MIKTTLAQQVGYKTGLPKEKAQEVIERTMSAIKEAMCKGESVYLRGFGTFQLKTRKQKVGRLIKKGEAVIVPAKSICKFKPCKQFSDKLGQSVPVIQPQTTL